MGRWGHQQLRVREQLSAHPRASHRPHPGGGRVSPRPHAVRGFGLVSHRRTRTRRHHPCTELHHPCTELRARPRTRKSRLPPRAGEGARRADEGVVNREMRPAARDARSSLVASPEVPRCVGDAPSWLVTLPHAPSSALDGPTDGPVSPRTNSPSPLRFNAGNSLAQPLLRPCPNRADAGAYGSP